MNKTTISWVLGPDGAQGFTWNPFAGCRESMSISQGCDRCYAARLASTRLAHLPAYKGLAKDARWTGEVRFFPEKLAEPLKRRKPVGIFVGDMGDIGLLEFEQIAAIFGVMAACSHHRFYLLTKRPGRLKDWFTWICEFASRPQRFGHVTERMRIPLELAHWAEAFGYVRPALGAKIPIAQAWPLPNVFVGTSVCTQEDADWSIPKLLQTPAAVRFLSVEPLLERVCISDIVNRAGAVLKPLDGLNWVPTARGMELSPKAKGPKLDWVIVGGESGPNARPCDAAWVRSIVEQCREASVACFLKQMRINGVLVDNPDFFPPDLRVRQMPEVSR